MVGRQLFSEGEKMCLQKLIVKYKLHSHTALGAGNITFKKNAWARITQEYNSVETNVKRTEAQLKKLWDNLKTRKKRSLALERKERMRPHIHPKPGTSSELTDDALADRVNLELVRVFNSDDTVEVMQIEPEIAVAVADNSESDNTNRESLDGIRRSGSRFSDYGSGQTYTQKNAIAQELKHSLENYSRKQAMEEELHKLKVEEAKWLMKAAEEKYKTAQIEKERAEELLRLTRIKNET